MDWGSEFTTALNDVIGNVIKHLTDRIIPWVLGGFRNNLASTVEQDERNTIFEQDSPFLLLLELCNNLKEVLTEYSVLDNIDTELAAYSEFLDDISNKRIRIYIFGHQNAGKSTLVNLLCELREGSPEGIDRCTACLVYIRFGKKGKVNVFRRDGTKHSMDTSEFWASMSSWALADEDTRPYRAEIFTKSPILGSIKNEIVDTPGSGSEGSLRGGNSDDCLIKEASESAVVAALIYRLGSTDSDAHRRYLADLSQLNQLGQNRVKIFSVCNIDPNYIDNHKLKRDQLRRSIQRAEDEIRDCLGGECFRINLAMAEHSPELAAKVEGSSSLNELIEAIRLAIRNRAGVLIHQGVPEAQSVILRIRTKAEKKLKELEISCIAYQQVLKMREDDLESLRQEHSQKTELERSSSDSWLGAAIGGGLGLALDALTFFFSVGAFAPIGAGIGSRLGARAHDAAVEEAEQKIGRHWNIIREQFIDCEWVLPSLRDQLKLEFSALKAQKSFTQLLDTLAEQNRKSRFRHKDHIAHAECSKILIELSELKEKFANFNG